MCASKFSSISVNIETEQIKWVGNLFLNGCFFSRFWGCWPAERQCSRPVWTRKRGWISGAIPNLSSGLWTPTAFTRRSNANWGTTASFFYNVFGERVAFTVKNSPRVLEQPTHSLDFTLSQRLWKNWKFKFSAKNLLDAEHRLVSKLDSEEAVYSSYRRGRAFSLSLNYEF